MIFDHSDTGKSYFIPDEKCDLDLFKVEGDILILSTGEKVKFKTKKGAEDAWIHFQECFRDHGTRLFFHEESSSFGYWL